MQSNVQVGFLMSDSKKLYSNKRLASRTKIEQNRCGQGKLVSFDGAIDVSI
jgi:hypothetical protein